MVTNVTSLGRSGLYDWMIQRATAVVVGVYVCVIVGFLLQHPDLSYEQWKAFMTTTAMRIFSVLSFIAVVAHVWVGLWTISTDYIKPMWLRLSFQGFCAVALFMCFVWAVLILWGV